ncbi:MAG: TonB-dependent receptor plug domain-containing protein [Desulfococcaceae bacterium]
MKFQTATAWNVLLTSLTLWFAPGAGALAQEAESVMAMDEIVVTATRTEEKSIDVPVKTDVITREEIELSGATHVGDIIGKYVTGHYHRYNGLLSPVGLRGFRTESHGDDVKGHVLILVDGHRMGTGNAAKINADRIERIEVTKGPASALYGSAALGGVINLITQKGEGDVSTTLGGDVGSFEYYKGQISSQGAVTEQFRYHLAASYEDIGDYDDPEFGTVYNTQETKNNFGGNLAFAPNDSHSFRFGGNYADLTGEYPSWLNHETYGAYDSETRSHYDKSHAYADLEYNGSFFRNQVSWRALAYYLRDRNHWFSGSPDPESNQSKYTDETLGTDHQFVWEMTDWNTLLVGFNLENLEKESEGVSGGEPSAPYTPGMEYDARAFFIQDSLDLLDNRVNIVAAGRYDRFDVKTQQPETVTIPDFIEREEDYDQFSPKLGAGVKFFDNLLRARANIGEGFKSPSADQLSADYQQGSGPRFIGNPDLDPETSLTYDMGFDVFHDFFTFKASFFHTDYEDKIVQTSIAVDGEPGSTWENRGDAEIEGFDLNLDWWIGQTFGLPFNLSLYSYLTFNVTKKDEETGEDLLYVSDYEAKSGLNFRRRDLSAQLSHVLVGPQMITNFDNFPYVDEEKGSFDFWDLNLRYQFRDNWEFRASVLNLFDQRVEWVRGFLMPERNYRVGVSFTF